MLKINNWQPYLYGTLIRTRPLTIDDFESLYEVASDPLIWEQHPDKERYRRHRFQLFFDSGIASKGALLIIDQKSGRIIGSSRFVDHDPQKQTVEVGYTFLSRAHWGNGYNRELKILMLDHAFRLVESVLFFVGETNYRSQKAVEKIGAQETKRATTVQLGGTTRISVIYEMKKTFWVERKNTVSFVQPEFRTTRLILEPITETHADELWSLFNNPELHQFVPFECLTLEKQKERFARWAKRRSPDGGELWLNWVARDRQTKKPIAHFQAGVKDDGIASVGYLVAKEFQRQGIAFEGLSAVFNYLRDQLSVREVKAWSDTRNLASHNLAKKLGMIQVEFIKDADRFNGTNSDEFVFSKVL